MKELSIEEKAKAYDEALKWMERIYPTLTHEQQMEAEAFFQIFKESEDEKIKQKIIKLVKMANKVGGFVLHKWEADEMIAWLEKQGNKDEEILILKDQIESLLAARKVLKEVHKIELEKQGEHNPTDKVEPKFKIGDKIIEKAFDECGCGTIIDIKDGKYIFDDGSFICIEEQDLWKLVEQKPAWSEEDEMFVHGLIRGLTAKRDIHGHTTFGSDSIDITETINWLKSLKDRALLYPVSVECNEEDIDNIVDTFIPEPVWYALEESEGEGSNAAAYDYSQMIAMFKAGVHWLKSLRPQNT